MITTVLRRKAKADAALVRQAARPGSGQCGQIVNTTTRGLLSDVNEFNATMDRAIYAVIEGNAWSIRYHDNDEDLVPCPCGEDNSKNCC